MQKKYFIVLGIVVIFICVFAGILLFQQTPHVSRQKVVVVSPNGKLTEPTTVVPTVSLPPLGSAAKEATLQFYIYYTSTSQNPFANGGYQASPYLSPEFKNVIASSYYNGNAPIFCPQNIKRNVVVGQEQTYYYNNGYLTTEVISEAPPAAKKLYNVTLRNMNGKWLIFDVNCVQ